MHRLRNPRPRGRGRAAPAAAAVACVLAAGGCGSVPAPGGGPPVPVAVVGRLTAIARRTAAVNGDRAPVWATAVLTTHAKALTSATPGDYDPGSGRVRVYLITMRGHFTDWAASVPPGAKVPTGRYLSLVLDARTFQGLDFGLSPKPPPVPPASLGPVTHLHLAPADG